MLSLPIFDLFAPNSPLEADCAPVPPPKRPFGAGLLVVYPNAVPKEAPPPNKPGLLCSPDITLNK